MKKRLFPILLSLLVSGTLMLVSCEKPNPQEEDPQNPDPVQPVEQVSIIGHWKMYEAFQWANGNFVDMINMYGQNFQLIFKEDGTLLNTDGINETEMLWTLNGDQLGFIQVAGMDPTMYTVKKLTADTLSIENGAGTDYVTTMNFLRVY